MKKIYIKQLLTAILLLCSTVVSAETYSGTCGTNVNWSLDTETGVLEITGTGAMTNYINYPASSQSPWSNYSKYITSINISNGITNIGDYAFGSCTSLASISIPNSVIRIGKIAFSSCWDLTYIEIPNSVTTIGERAFSSCMGLTSVTIPNSVTTIEESTFSGCTGLTSITIPNNVTTIEDYAFSDCSGLTNITIGNSVTTIGDYAFNSCTGLTSIKVESGNKKYDSRDNCNAIIETATNTLILGCSNTCIPNNITKIGDHSFQGYFTSIIIPNSVTTIGESAFSGCWGLTSITIPNSVTTIGAGAFYGCSNLTNIEIPNSVTKIGAGAFDRTAWLENQPGGVVYAGKVLYAYKGTMPQSTSIIIKEGTLGIAQEAFNECSSLTSIEIPNSVTTIGESAFEGCDSLTSISIPNSVTTIGDYAFRFCKSLTSVTIGNSVTSIGQSAFSSCTSLTSIEIPNSVTTIGGGAFHSCKSLASVTIPNSVTTIGGSAFHSCKSLTSVTIGNSVTSIGDWAFESCSGLTSITIPNSVTTIGERAFYDCTGLTSITIPNSVTTIGDYAFYDCTGLTSVTIGNSVTTIGDYAFRFCSWIAEIYSLAETPATIGSYTFTDYSDNLYSATLYVPAGAKAAYQAADYWKNFTNIVEMTPTEETPTEVTITIGQYGTATYCSPYALDFSEVEGLKAYTATGYNSSTGVVTLTRAQTAEDATGLFLMGEPGEYTVPVIEYSSDYMLNMLVGTLEATAVNNKTDDGNYINFKYTIGSESSLPMFYQFEDGSTLSAGKAYLQLPARLFTTTASKSISLRFDDGQLTDIDRVESESNDTQTIIYDLCGRRVSKPAKGGIYIKNGKKIIL